MQVSGKFYAILAAKSSHGLYLQHTESPIILTPRTRCIRNVSHNFPQVYAYVCKCGAVFDLSGGLEGSTLQDTFPTSQLSKKIWPGGQTQPPDIIFAEDCSQTALKCILLH